MLMISMQIQSVVILFANYSDYQSSNTNKVVTPGLLNQILNDPVTIGNNDTTGTFDSLTVNSITILNDTLETNCWRYWYVII